MKTKVKSLNRLQKEKRKERHPSDYNNSDYNNYEDKQRSRTSKKKWNRKDFE